MIDTEWLQPLLDWVEQNPGWANAVVFAIALAESLVVVGLIVPGAFILFGVGALIAVGLLDPWQTYFSAVAGAIVGDGLSYWLGVTLKQRLWSLWPMSRYPSMIKRGQSFFAQHGGKSIVFGRFIGPVRPIVPAIAGVMGMSFSRFTVINVLSAFAWAPAYLIPGAVFGASIGLASAVSMRLVAVLVIVSAALVIVLWLVRLLARWVQANGAVLINAIWQWNTAHPLIGKVTEPIINPHTPEVRALTVFAAIIMLLGGGFIYGIGGLFGGEVFSRFDKAIFALLEAYQTPWLDSFAVICAELGGAVVNGAMITTVLFFLMGRRHWLGVGHWAAAMLFALVMIYVSSQLLGPTNIESWRGYAGHITLAMIMYGFLAVMLAKEVSSQWRWSPYAQVTILVLLFTLSAIYLGQIGASEALISIVLAMLWVTSLGVAYRRRVGPKVCVHHLAAIVFSIVTMVGAWAVGDQYTQAMSRLEKPKQAHTSLTVEQWHTDGWQELPSHRFDFHGEDEQPMTLQWAGEQQVIEQTLRDKGWQAAPELDVPAMLQWFNAEPELNKLPVLPQVHSGQVESVLFVHAIDKNRRRPVIRLWSTDATILPKSGTAEPLWIGYVGYQSVENQLALLAVPVTLNDPVEPLHFLQQQLVKVSMMEKARGRLSVLLLGL